MGVPDFVGYWIEDPFSNVLLQKGVLPRPEYGLFSMYVQERKSIKDGVEAIKGTIKDCLGDATFEGELSKNHVRFTKRYTKETFTKLEWGRDLNFDILKIEYEGKKVNEKYVGQYTVKNGLQTKIINGIEKNVTCDFTYPFWMQNYFDPSMN